MPFAAEYSPRLHQTAGGWIQEREGVTQNKERKDRFNKWLGHLLYDVPLSDAVTSLGT